MASSCEIEVLYPAEAIFGVLHLMHMRIAFEPECIVVDHQVPDIQRDPHPSQSLETAPPLYGKAVQDVVLLKELPIGPLQIQSFYLCELVVTESHEVVHFELVVAVEGEDLKVLVASENARDCLFVCESFVEDVDGGQVGVVLGDVTEGSFGA